MLRMAASVKPKGFERNLINIRRNKTVVIGDTAINKLPGSKPKLIPSDQFEALPQELIQHLRWMGQKYNLNQVKLCLYFFIVVSHFFFTGYVSLWTSWSIA